MSKFNDSDRELVSLLRQADQSAPHVPIPTADIPARVRRRIQVRRRLATGTAIVATACLMALSSLHFPHRPAADSKLTAIAPASVTEAGANNCLPATLAASVIERTAQTLLVHERLRTAETRAAIASKSVERLTEARDASALLLVQQAERAARSSNNGLAQHRYSRVVELFPDSPAAAVAAKQLRSHSSNGL